MKTNILGTGPRRTVMALRASVIPALVSLPLCLAAGCAMSPDDDGATVTRSQAVTGGCEVQLPLAWTGFGVTCIEDSGFMTISLAYGESYFATAFGNGARGHAEFRCTPGPLETVSSFCVASEGSPE
jgi:hypothetical protein